ncbi:hypothetical protein [Paenarthrobacter sp. NPDC058040]|uniref:hypothetical protein n=1 Tax=Paenarthrobacter TaxID=1742992 RepID=UPI0036DA93DD
MSDVTWFDPKNPRRKAMDTPTRVLIGFLLVLVVAAGYVWLTASNSARPTGAEKHINKEVEDELNSLEKGNRSATAAEAKTAGTLIEALAAGGDGTAFEYIASDVLFNAKAVMRAIENCRITSPWETYDDGESVSSELTCRDGDLVTVDVYLNGSGRVVRASGLGANPKHNFDSAE